jgi:very-short-patch-repair endonuclease
MTVKISKAKSVELEDVKKYVQSQGYSLISTSYKNARTPLEMLCPKNHICKPTWDKFKNQNRRCGNCAGNVKYTTSYVKDYIEGQKYIMISDEYTGSKNRIKIKCPDNHETSVFFDNFKNKKYRCNKCHKDLYKHEKECRSILEKITNKKFPSVRPNFLKNPITNCNLELDGYCEELKLAFEYDGEQHYKDNCWLTKEERACLNENDVLKDKICKIHGIILIRIPYFEKHNKELFILNQLKELYER